MCYIGYKHFQTTKLPDSHPAKADNTTLLGPALTILGLMCMYFGRTYTTITAADGTEAQEAQWTILYWIGEALVIGMFTYNSISTSLPSNAIVLGAIAIFSTVFALWFRGRFWNYVIVMIFELALILFVVMAFPVMEMVLETILNEKLRKVGDKVRAHQKQLEAYYLMKELQRGK